MRIIHSDKVWSFSFVSVTHIYELSSSLTRDILTIYLPNVAVLEHQYRWSSSLVSFCCTSWCSIFISSRMHMVRTEFIHYICLITTVYISQRRHSVFVPYCVTLNRLFLSCPYDNRCIHATLDAILLEPFWSKRLIPEKLQSKLFFFFV